jgi:DNA-binding beta-propeller fold protein YncE
VRLRQLMPLVLAPVMALGSAGLSADDKPAKNRRAAAPSRPLTWPIPPEQPRIRYLTSYHGAGDFKTRKTGRWKSMLLGDDGTDATPVDTLVKPYAIAVGPNGRIYVTDTAVRRVFVFDPDAKTLTFVGDTGTGKLTKPVGVAVDDEGTVFVADATLNRVFGYAPDGRVVLAIGKEGELRSPSGLAVDRTNKRVYVADAAKHQVLCYSTVDGSLIRTIGKRGGDAGEFNFPTNLFVDREGRLYVSDTMNFRVQMIDADGRPLGTFGKQGDTPGSFNRPKGVAVDSEGHIYVADGSFNNFQVFDAEQRLLLFVGSAGHESGEFYLPAGLYIDNRDWIYVADQGNSRVQVFQYLRGGAK